MTTPNPEYNEDMEMFKILGLTPKAAFSDGDKPETKPDEILDARKAKEAARALELKAARAKVEGFEPRKVTTVGSL